MQRKASIHWAAPLSAMCALLPPYCGHWPSPGPGGGGQGHAGSAHAGSGAEAGGGAAGEAGTGGKPSAALPVIGCPAGPWPDAPELEILDDAGGASASLLSGDGKVAVGSNADGPVFWSPSSTAHVELPYGTPRAVSCDGSTVIGNVSDTIVAFRAHISGTFSYLQTPTDPSAWTTEEDVSESGLALGNHRYPEPVQPITWDASGASTALSALTGLEARKLSPDGQTIWGVTHDCATGCTTDAIFRYSEAEGITRYPLGAVPGNIVFANDGSALYELAEEDGVPLPYETTRPLHRFDSATGTFSSIPCSATRCWPTAVSSRAAVALFYSWTAGAPTSDFWVWDEAHGVRSTAQLLADLDLTVDGPLAPQAISDDARALAGIIVPVEGPFTSFHLLAPRGTFY